MLRRYRGFGDHWVQSILLPGLVSPRVLIVHADWGISWCCFGGAVLALLYSAGCAGNGTGVRKVAAREDATLSGFGLFARRLFYGLFCGLFNEQANHSFNTDYCLVNRLRNHLRVGDGRILVVRA
jgi:hypothetical protein